MSPHTPPETPEPKVSEEDGARQLAAREMDRVLNVSRQWKQVYENERGAKEEMKTEAAYWRAEAKREKALHLAKCDELNRARERVTQARAEGERAGREKERAAVASWLRRPGWITGTDAAEELARRIEGGDHRQGGSDGE